MLKAQCKTANGRFTFEVQGDGVKEVFRDLAALQEVFDAESKCGCCQSDNIRLQYRERDKFKFYELVCRACTARFQFGQTREGNALFPKRRAEGGKPLPNGGWEKYEGHHTEAPEEAPAPPRSAPASNRPANAAPVKPQVFRFKNWDEVQQSLQFGKSDVIIEVTDDENSGQWHLPKGAREYQPWGRTQ